MNGNIFNHSLASIPYSFGSCGLSSCNTNATPPNPPASTINGEPIFAQSHINAYNTAFNQPNIDYQVALKYYRRFTSSDVNSNFVPGTFEYKEEYNGQGSNLGNSITIGPLQDYAGFYSGIPSLFISAGSGGGFGFMYLELGYSNLWSTLYSKYILKIAKKSAR